MDVNHAKARHRSRASLPERPSPQPQQHQFGKYHDEDPPLVQRGPGGDYREATFTGFELVVFAALLLGLLAAIGLAIAFGGNAG